MSERPVLPTRSALLARLAAVKAHVRLIEVGAANETTAPSDASQPSFGANPEPIRALEDRLAVVTQEPHDAIRERDYYHDARAHRAERAEAERDGWRESQIATHTELDIEVERTGALRAELDEAQRALKLAYPYVMDALKDAEKNSPGTAHIVRDDLEQHIVPALHGTPVPARTDES